MNRGDVAGSSPDGPQNGHGDDTIRSVTAQAHARAREKEPARLGGTVSLLIVGGRTPHAGLPVDADAVVAAAVADRLCELSANVSVSGALDMPAHLDDDALSSTVLGAIGHLTARGHQRILFVSADPRNDLPLRRLAALDLPGAATAVFSVAEFLSADVTQRRSLLAAREVSAAHPAWQRRLRAFVAGRTAATGENALRRLARRAQAVVTELQRRPVTSVPMVTARMRPHRPHRRASALTLPGPRASR